MSYEIHSPETPASTADGVAIIALIEKGNKCFLEYALAVFAVNDYQAASDDFRGHFPIGRGHLNITPAHCNN